MKIILPKNLTYLILLIIICNTKIYSSSNRYISGRIVDLANEPVAGDTIWFTENTDLIEPFFAVTNSQGNYSASFFIETGVDRENATIPDQYSLVTWPNPGGPGMAINIPQNTKTQIKISIYDILGRKVRHWNYSPNQTNILLWDGRNSDGRMCSTGVYFISVEHGKKFSNYKFTFLQNNFSSPQIMQGKNSDLYKANINDVTFNIKITGPDIFQKTDEIIFPSNNDSLIFDATVNRLPYLQEWNLPDTIHVETGDNWNINLDEYFENDNPENATYFCSDPQVSISDSIATYENIQPVIKTFFFEAHELSYKVASPSITISPSNLSDTVPNVSISVDKTEGDPGLKVNFTIDIIDGNKPFKILPEFNNDFYRDAELETTERAITLSYTYDQADLYVPWFYVIDSDQDTVKVFSPKVICVNTLINPVNGVGLKLPTSTDPVGDYLKGFQIFSINQHLFESSEGELFIKNELQRLKDLGVNFLVYNPMWFADRVNSNVNYPRYHKEWAPDHFMHSLHLDELAKLINWSHDFGFKVGLRCFLHVIDLNVHTGSLRGSYNPGNRSTYLDYQKQIKALYAKFVELFNIELFSIEAENPGFSFFEDSKCVIDTIRQFYNGVLTDSPGYFEVYSSPLIPYLDLISFSHYSFYGTSLSDETNRVDTLSAKTFEKVFTNSLKYEVIPFVNHYQKPCLIMEIGGAIRDWTEEYQANLFNGILESFNKEIERDSLLMGLTIWDWDVDLLDFPPWSPRGFRAENIISDYFNNILPDYYAHRKTPLNYSAPPLWKSIEHFEVPSLPEYYYWEYEPGDWDIVWSLDSDNDFSGQKSLKLEFQNLPKKDFYTGGIGTFFNPSNWSEFERINLWLKIQENIKSDISLSIFDNDGDRFLINANSKPYQNDWSLLSLEFADFFQPHCVDKNDGHLDLQNIKGYFLVFTFFHNGPNFSLNIDNMYLSKGINDTIPVPNIDEMLIDFEMDSMPANYFINSKDERIEVQFSLDSSYCKNGKKSLRYIVSNPINPETWYWSNLLREHQSSSLDWSAYSKINFWIDAHETMSDVVVNVWDADGDRFIIGTDNRSYIPGWSLISFDFSDFQQPEWFDKNDGILDLSNISMWGIGVSLHYEGNEYLMHVDDIYLSY